ncbi:unnamed protein product [Dicrocoelium dendriticum]|nr:unnamed protein product [Dicrocoelium dendriticum]
MENVSPRCSGCLDNSAQSLVGKFDLQNQVIHERNSSNLDVAQSGWSQLLVHEADRSVLHLVVDYGGEVNQHSTPFSQAVLRGERQRRRSIKHGLKTMMKPEQHENLPHIRQFNFMCLRPGSATKLSFLVQFNHHMYSHRNMYKCFVFNILDETETTRAFELEHSYVKELGVDPDVCDHGSFSKRTSIWISIPGDGHPITRTNCPIVGGFQILRTTSSEKPGDAICDSKLFGFLQSECLSGEGMEWRFSDTNCNPFGHQHVTRFNCHSSWRKGGLQYVVIYRKSSNHAYEIYQMVYNHLPAELEQNVSTYGPYSSICLIRGLRTTSILQSLATCVSNAELWHNQTGGELMPQTEPVFRIRMRRAFGACDDEQEACDKGCSFSPLNQYLCHRTCLKFLHHCDGLVRDPCSFPKYLMGRWNLIEDDHSCPYEGRPVKYHSLIVERNKLILNSPTMSNMGRTLDCVRLRHEGDRHQCILRLPHQSNGCPPRDSCVSFYQLSRTDAQRNYMNSLIFTMSQSRRLSASVNELCEPRQNQLLHSHIFQTDKWKTLVREVPLVSAHDRVPPKCALYQMDLRGTATFGSNFWNSATCTQEGQYASSYKTMPTDWEMRLKQWGSKDDSRNLIPLLSEFSHPHGIMSRKRNFDNSAFAITHDNRTDCYIRITDFNTELGSTGEFDSKLRIKSVCRKKEPMFLSNVEHTCLSSLRLHTDTSSVVRHQMIVTYVESLGKYYCWFLSKEEQNSETGITAFVFASPHCRYRRLMPVGFEPDERRAIVQMSLKSYKKKCPECKSSHSTLSTIQDRFPDYMNADSTSHRRNNSPTHALRWSSKRVNELQANQSPSVFASTMLRLFMSSSIALCGYS